MDPARIDLIGGLDQGERALESRSDGRSYGGGAPALDECTLDVLVV
jgi:hypothetical protein